MFITVRRSHFRAAVSLWLLSLFAFAPGSAPTGGQEPVASPAPTSRVLVLYSQQRGAPIVDQWGRGIRESIEAEFGKSVIIDSEYLDFDRLETDQERQEILEFVLAKYRGMAPDVIIPVHDLVTELFVRSNPFPDAAVVFCSILEETRRRLPQGLNATGVSYRFDAGRTVRYARRLFPSTHTVVVISGSGDADVLLLKSIQPELTSNEELRFEYWTGVPFETLLERASYLPDGHLILFNSYIKDQDGRNAPPAKDLVEQIASASNVPVFALYDTLVGAGIVGGYMPIVDEQGRLAGELAARVLKGESPANTPFEGRAMNRLVVDWRQLRRWGLEGQELPAGSVVLFREETIWEAYRWYVIPALLAIVLESLLIVALLVQRKRQQELALARERTEAELRVSRSEAQHLSTRIVTAMEDERKRIARELHDDVSQRLAAGAMQASRLEQQAAGSTSILGTVSQLKNNLLALSQDVHRLSRTLYPPTLLDFGLREALRVECDRAAERGQLPVHFRCGELPEGLPKRLELCLYRVAQEALSNAIRHARTPRVEVLLNSDLEFLELEVKDFGIGFDPEQSTRGIGLGLQSMRDRVSLEQGEILISSVPTQGTRVQVRLPLGECQEVGDEPEPAPTA